MLKNDWIIFSKYDNHVRSDTQHNLGGGGRLYDHLRNTIIFTLVMN